MAYTATTWVNGTSPAMSAANLNKLTDELEAQAAAEGISHSLPTWVNGAAPAITSGIPWNEMERVAYEVAIRRALSYTRTTWSDGWTPARNATNLNKLEQQVAANSNASATPGDATGRWYADTSLWNRPIRANPPIRSNNTSLINALVAAGNFGPGIWYVPSIWTATASTPVVSVRVDNSPASSVNVRIPTGILPDNAPEGITSILDETNGDEIQFYKLRLPNTNPGNGSSDNVSSWGALAGTGTGTFTVSSGGSFTTAADLYLIGQEVISATRSGTTMTVTARGVQGTTVQNHPISNWGDSSVIRSLPGPPTGFSKTSGWSCQICRISAGPAPGGWRGSGSTIGSPRGSSTNSASGAIRPRDTQKPTGSFWDHALAIVYMNTWAGNFVAPALSSDGTRTDTNVVVPMGARLQLNPSVNVDSLLSAYPEWMRQFARTLQVYGAYVVDTNEGLGGPLIQHRLSVGSYRYPWEPTWSGIPNIVNQNCRWIDWSDPTNGS